MHVFEATTAHELYRRQLAALLQEGEEVTVRGMPTKELLNVATVIHNPCQRVHIVPGRQANPYLALSECFWMLAGSKDVNLLTPYNKGILDYSDDGKTLYGSYGYRIRDQIAPLIERLRHDPADRRAVLAIWEADDLTAITKDPCCNTQVQFKLRNNRLHMTVINRSNDIHYGLYAVNLPQFSFLQEYIAARLGVEVGIQTHMSNSLHVYLAPSPAAKITTRMLDCWPLLLPVIPNVEKTFPSLLPEHNIIVLLVRDVLGAPKVNCTIPFFNFADDYLTLYRSYGRKGYSHPDFQNIRYKELYPDWIMAAETFGRGE